MRRNLVESFPMKSEQEIKRIEKKFYHFFVDMIFESCKLAFMSQREMKQRMKFINVEKVNAMIRQGRSNAIYLGHYGNWEWVSSMPLWLDKRMTGAQIYHKLSNKHMDRLMLGIRERMGAACVEMHKTARYVTELMAGHKVCVKTEKGIVKGIIGCDPLQNNGTDNGILVKTSDLWIDIGAQDAEEARKMVQVGDFGVFKPDFISLGEKRLASKAFDDRLGVFVMLEVMKELQKDDLDIGVIAVSSVQEEISMRGVAACKEKFSAAIVLDVDFATDVPVDNISMGDLSLGNGVGLNLNADSNIVLQNIFCDVCKANSIPVQRTISRNISGGTDSTVVQSLGDIASLNVNLPLRYIHSHYEVCDIRDIDYAVNSVCELIRTVNRDNIRTFVPWY